MNQIYWIRIGNSAEVKRAEVIKQTDFIVGLKIHQQNGKTQLKYYMRDKVHYVEVW